MSRHPSITRKTQTDQCTSNKPYDFDELILIIVNRPKADSLKYTVFSSISTFLLTYPILHVPNVDIIIATVLL